MAANAMDDTSGLVSIGQLAKGAGVSSRTIRYYEELGILPEPHRSPGGTRRYPREYRDYIDTALTLKNLGFRLEEIKPLVRLAIGRSVSAAQRETAAGLIEERIEALERQISVLGRLRDSVRRPDAATAVPMVLGSADLAAPPALHADAAADPAVAQPAHAAAAQPAHPAVIAQPAHAAAAQPAHPAVIAQPSHLAAMARRASAAGAAAVHGDGAA
jgi:DNA-binding transcriptional MerR regulator